MSAIAISFLVFASLFLGVIVGMFLRSMLPEKHLSADSKDTIKLGTGLIGTMAALLLGLLVASAKSSYDTEKGELTQMAGKISFLDRALANYGSETHEARDVLRSSVVKLIDQMWPQDATKTAQLDPATSSGEALFEALHRLAPRTEEQTALKGQALGIAWDIGQTRWLLYSQRESSISMPMLIVVIFWLTTIFVSYGLFAPHNITVVATMILCALSVAGAIFLVLELDRPFGGTIQISNTAIGSALNDLGK
jgi:hypothetical protein